MSAVKRPHQFRRALCEISRQFIRRLVEEIITIFLAYNSRITSESLLRALATPLKIHRIQLSRVRHEISPLNDASLSVYRALVIATEIARETCSRGERLAHVFRREEERKNRASPATRRTQRSPRARTVADVYVTQLTIPQLLLCANAARRRRPALSDDSLSLSLSIRAHSYRCFIRRGCKKQELLVAKRIFTRRMQLAERRSSITHRGRSVCPPQERARVQPTACVRATRIASTRHVARAFAAI